MLGWDMCIGLWKCICLFRWNFYGSSLPFCLFVCLGCDTSLLRWSSIYWCEERFSWSTRERGLRCIVHLGWSWCYFVGLLLGLRPMYPFDLWTPYVLLNFITGFSMVPWCVLCCKELGRTLGLRFMLSRVTFPLILFIKLNGTLHILSGLKLYLNLKKYM